MCICGTLNRAGRMAPPRYAYRGTYQMPSFFGSAAQCLQQITQSTSFIFQAFHNNACNTVSLHKLRLTAKLDRTGNPSIVMTLAFARLTPMTRLRTPPHRDIARHSTDKSTERFSMRFYTRSTPPSAYHDTVSPVAKTFPLRLRQLSDIVF